MSPGSYSYIAARVVDQRIHDRPGGFDDVLAREERGVACHRVAEQPLVVAQARALGWLLHRPTARRGWPTIASPGRLARAPTAIATSGLSRKRT